jgi:hypothetical protein
MLRRLLVPFIGLTLALSPVALVGIGGGAPAAHADLGWCDTCGMVGLPPSATPPPNHHQH